MSFSGLYISWFDFLVLMVLGLGVVRGRKRGMSEELLDLLKWLAILLSVAFFCQPMGDFLADFSVFSRLSCYMAIYATIILVFQVATAFVRRHVGQKLVSSDVFGPTEYYLGMASGMVRFGCILIACLAFLHARHYSTDEINAREAYQEKNYGSIRFPTLYAIQQEVFDRSYSGRGVENILGPCLIRSTEKENKQLQTSRLIERRQRNVYEVLEK